MAEASAGVVERVRRKLGHVARESWRSLVSAGLSWRPNEEALSLLVAMGIGIVGGIVNLLFSFVLQAFHWLIWRDAENLVQAAESASVWVRAISPMVGALVAGLTLWYFRRKGVGIRTENILEVVASGDGRLSLRRSLYSGVSSMVSLVSGASLGKEGAITNLSSALASAFGQARNWPPFRLRLMVACGAAAGMAAAYNAPIAGAVFAAQVILGNFAMTSFAPLVVASVSATVTSRIYLGVGPIFEPPEFELSQILALPSFVVLGVICGLVGAVFLRGLTWGRYAFRKLGWPAYATLPVGGAVVGLISIYVPEVWGNGDVLVNQTLSPISSALSWLLILMVVKMIATIVTVSSGAVGGVFTPTLLVGALVGSIFGQLLHMLGLYAELPNYAFALIGMGGMLAAMTHSVLLAIIMVFEISLNYSAMPAIMLCAAVATLVSRRFHVESMYTLPLKRLNLSTRREVTRVGAAMERTVGDIMEGARPTLVTNTSYSQIVRYFLTRSAHEIWIVDPEGRLVGEVRLQDLKQWLNLGDTLEFVIAEEIMREAPMALTPDDRLPLVLSKLIESENSYIPVVNNTYERRLLGGVNRKRALSIFYEGDYFTHRQDGEG